MLLDVSAVLVHNVVTDVCYRMSLLCAKHRCCCVFSFDVVIVALLLFDAHDVDVTDVCISVVAMQSDVAVIVVVVVILPDELLEENNVDVQLDALEVLFELYVQH